MATLLLELQEILLETKIEMKGKARTNSRRAVREAIDERFASGTDWVKTAAGGVGWVKKVRYNSTFIARIGVEVQVSARSDLLIRDIVHLRNSLQKGQIDVGVIVVPDDRFQTFLTDRTPSFRDAVRYIEQEFKEAMTFPIVLIAVEHDAVGRALAKKKTNLGKGT